MELIRNVDDEVVCQDCGVSMHYECADGNRWCNKCTQTRETKENELQEALAQAGLVIREDSKMCERYISGNYTYLADVVDKMSWAKLTREYCDWEFWCNKAEQMQTDELDAGYIPDIPVNVQAEALIRQSLSENTALERPWQIGLSPAEWRKTIQIQNPPN
jgi:hypothetical protein